MTSPDRGPWRLARTGVFVLVCLVLAALAHAMGGGGRPGTVALLLPVPVLTLTGLWFTRCERGVSALFAVLGGLQALLHVYLHLALHAKPVAMVAGHHGVPTLAGPVGAATGDVATGAHAGASALDAATHTGALDAAGHLIGSAPGAAAAHTMDAAALLPSPTMLGAHLLALALTACMLGWGERSLWALARRLRWRLPRPVRIELGGPAVLPSYVSVVLHGVAARRLGTVRGPPLGVRPA